jgi:16S rRNA C967 or C1407 C5-methylase (RsmB/RsmF family)
MSVFPPPLAAVLGSLGLEPWQGERARAFRANPLRQPAEALAAELAAAGLPAAPHPLSPWSFATDAAGEYAVKGSDAYREGRLYCQSLASQLPALLCERLDGPCLDACAAPGGKTTLLAARLGPRGRVLALERSRVRFQKLLHTLRLLGAGGRVQARCCDARFPGADATARAWPCVLLDPPCSGSGLVRLGDPRTWEHLAPDYDGYVAAKAALQARLLRQWSALLAPGGELVYSTCSVDPREDEAVVDACLRAEPRLDLADLAPWRDRLPAARPGLPGWGSAAFDPRLGRCLRLDPCAAHEGFFVARLLRRA